MSNKFKYEKKLLKIISKVKKNKDKYIDCNTNVWDVIKKCESEHDLYLFKEKIYFCINNTKYENKDAILMIFIMTLPGLIGGSSRASEMVMGLYRDLEKVLYPIQERSFTREIDKLKRNIAILKIIKIY